MRFVLKRKSHGIKLRIEKLLSLHLIKKAFCDFRKVIKLNKRNDIKIYFKWQVLHHLIILFIINSLCKRWKKFDGKKISPWQSNFLNERRIRNNFFLLYLDCKLFLYL